VQNVGSLGKLQRLADAADLGVEDHADDFGPSVEDRTDRTAMGRSEI
jgi:hypothetical protein